MIGQHRPLSQSAENHLSRGHGCSSPTEQANIARAKKLIAAPLPSIDPAAEHDDVDPAAGALEDHSADLALLVAIG